MIRLACVSDTHDAIPPTGAIGEIAAWLHAGDFYEASQHALVADVGTDDWLRREWDLKKGDAIRQWLAGQSVPVFSVHGNHDGKDFWNLFTSLYWIDGRIVPLADHLYLAGIGWFGDRYYESPGESDLQRICDDIRRQVQRRLMADDALVLLTHYPASLPGLFPVDGKIAGIAYDCVRQLIEDLGPLAVVQGHNHAWFGLSATYKHARGSTLVLNPGPKGAMLWLDVKGKRASCLPWCSED